MPEIQLTALEKLDGRGHSYVRAFGSRTSDAKQRAVEVQIDAADAVDMLRAFNVTGEFPPMTVANHEWCFVMCVDRLPLIVAGGKR